MSNYIDYMVNFSQSDLRGYLGEDIVNLLVEWMPNGETLLTKKKMIIIINSLYGTSILKNNSFRKDLLQCMNGSDIMAIKDNCLNGREKNESDPLTLIDIIANKPWSKNAVTYYLLKLWNVPEKILDKEKDTDVVENEVDTYIGDNQPSSEWDLAGLNQSILEIMPIKLLLTKDEILNLSKAEFKQTLKAAAVKLYEDKEAEFPEPEQIREIERIVLLKVIDRKWMDHIDDMDQLKQGIGLMAYGQKDPIVEYKMAGFDMFDDMISAIQEDTVRLLYHVQVEQKVEREQVAKISGTNKDESAQNAPKRRAAAKVYPNDPCPCGSGKKYKQCCGRVK